jgi:hypothetical protein
MMSAPGRAISNDDRRAGDFLDRRSDPFRNLGRAVRSNAEFERPSDVDPASVALSGHCVQQSGKIGLSRERTFWSNVLELCHRATELLHLR